MHVHDQSLGKTLSDVNFFMERGTCPSTGWFSWSFNDSNLFSGIFIYSNLFFKIFNTSTLFSRSFNTSKLFSGTFKKCRVLKLKALAWKDNGEAFSLARIAEARFEDERSITDIAKTNDLNARVQVQDLEETIRHKPNKVEAFRTSMVATFEEHEQQENQDNLNEFSKEKDDAKPPIFIDTVDNNGDNDSRISGSKTPAKEVVDNGIESKVVVGLPEEFQEGDMVDALSMVEHKSLENWKEFVKPT
ncbi:hypothetical protein Tco_1261710 [Tanacetum coccineum]